MAIVFSLGLCTCGQNFNSDSGDAAYANLGSAQPTYSYLSANLFNQCTGCHVGGASAPAGYDLSSLNEIIATGAVVPGNLNSPAYQAVFGGRMPQGGPDLEASDPSLVSAFATWIQNGAPNN